MSEANHGAVIDALRSAGADQFAPLRLHYLAALHHRASTERSKVKSILDAKLAQALATFQEEFAQAQRVPKTIDAPKPCAPLADLVRDMAQATAVQAGGTRSSGHDGVRTELKAVRNFRNTWSKLSADKQLSRALDQAPRNAGPINSHMLVLRSLALMREISPDYLNRFISYADTLLCLDQDEKPNPPPAKKPQSTKPTKPTKPTKK